ncbi:MAG: Xaa-Pro dipeptidase [Candidatus Tokpelaia hoelldobleri]|uniref:Xaa-Pro dipeptidase n=1 Tax=Candidatus Tokpelaia hoelldobleri TaxID=1902579 RepID=A0A1U9JVI0_9HYPH|nr:MAG: Xaa-Pro dipeptidase [Candidatus Tokpelaia hoelldoblerii]
MSLWFSAEEYKRRRNTLLSHLKKDKLDAVLLFAQESMYWLTGYETFGFCLFQCLVVKADGEQVLLTRAPDLRQAQATSNITNIVVWQDGQDANPALDLRNLLNDLGLLGCRVGIEYRAHGLTGADCRRLDEQLANFAKIIDISGMVDHLRLVKSDEEIAFVRKAAALTDEGLKTALKLVRKGANEADILTALTHANFSGGGDFPANDYVIGSGSDALLCRSHSGRRKLAARDQLTLEWSGVFRHYHAPMMRTVLVGKPDPRHIELYEAADTAMTALEKAMQPTTSFGSLFDIYARIIEDHNLTRHRFNACGYPVGARFAPSWMEDGQIQSGNNTPIKPGMVLLVHAMLFDSDATIAMAMAQTYLITQNGAKSLSHHPRELIVK